MFIYMCVFVAEYTAAAVAPMLWNMNVIPYGEINE